MSARINSLEQNVEALYKDIRYGDPHTRWYTLGKLTSTLFVGMVGGGVSSVLGEGAETATALGITQSEMRSRVLANIAESRTAREVTGFPILSAKTDQILSGYLSDVWQMTTLRKGELVYGGLPGPSAYFTDKNAILGSLGDRNVLYKNLQVKLNPERGAYRPNIGVYQLSDNVRVPTSIIKANPTLGPGGEVQFFIGTGSSSKLTLLNEIELREFYEQSLSTYRPGY